MLHRVTSLRAALVVLLAFGGALPGCAQKPQENPQEAKTTSTVPRCRGDGPPPSWPGADVGPSPHLGDHRVPVAPHAVGHGRQGAALPRLRREGPGLRFDLTFSGPGSEEPEKVPVPLAGDVHVVMHTPSGEVAPECADSEIGGWAGGSLGTSGDMTFPLPLQANALREAWIEVRLAKISYWLTVPYGFTAIRASRSARRILRWSGPRRPRWCTRRGARRR